MRALRWIASFRLRILFRTSFLLLALAVLGMAVAVLHEEKQRSFDHYQAGIGKTKAQIVARLRHPSGQLALLNPPRADAPAGPLRPVVLPFSALDFDDQIKVRNAIEMAGCLVQYRRYGSLCLAIGNNPWAGGFIYAAGTFASPDLVAHRIGDERLDGAHRVRVTATVRGITQRWLAPFEPLDAMGNGGQRGRFTGYVEREGPNYRGSRPVKEFRGWVWQGAGCVEAAQEAEGCDKRSFFSLRLPVEALTLALFQKERPQWPPPDLDEFRVRVEVLPPGEGPALFDSDEAGAVPPFSLTDLTPLLLPGESLSIRRMTAGGGESEVIRLTGREEIDEPISPLLAQLVRALPVPEFESQVELADEIATPLGSYRLLLRGDGRSVNRTLSAVASRVSWFVGAMLGAIGLAWLVIEAGIVRRIARLTRRTRGLSATVHGDGGLERYDLSDLRGGDELGILGGCLNDLLLRVQEDAERERIRAEQEKDMWHAVGHEIMSPLQSLLALHGRPEDPSHRYIQRMQQAVRVLYGSASPSEAFQSSSLQLQVLDIAEFLRHVAENAGFDAVVCSAEEGPLAVRADEYPLEDVFSHLLKNADRHRHPGTAITLSLESSETTATITVHNQGPPIPEALIDKVFEYGVSDQHEPGNNGSRGQGLFVAKTYMAKMGGTISVRNGEDGVSFVLTLQRVRG